MLVIADYIIWTQPLTPRDRASSAEHCGCQHLVSHGGRVSSDNIPGQHVPTNVLEFLIFFGINRNTNENGESFLV